MTDLGGRPTDAAIPNALAVVLVFVQPECPISNRYAPELARLAAEYGPRGVAFRLVYAGEVPAEDARAHHEDYFRTFEALLDPDADLARRTGVTVTPEVAVLAAGDRVVYRGRIDDRYVSFGRQRARPHHRDLADALDALLEGRTPEVRETSAIGCFLVVP